MLTRQLRNGLGAAALCSLFLLAISGILFTDTHAENYTSQCPLSADLTGSAISNMTPAGTARFREKGNNRLMLNLRQVNVAANTNLDVYVGDTKVGTVEVGKGRSGQLRLDSPTGTIDDNSIITVRNGSDTILTGTFACTNAKDDKDSNSNENLRYMNLNPNPNSNNGNMNNMNINSNSNRSNSNRGTNRNTNTNTNRNRNTNTNTNGNTNTNTNSNTHQ
jgi:hypothetical protein